MIAFDEFQGRFAAGLRFPKGFNLGLVIGQVRIYTEDFIIISCQAVAKLILVEFGGLEQAEKALLCKRFPANLLFIALDGHFEHLDLIIIMGSINQLLQLRWSIFISNLKSTEG